MSRNTARASFSINIATLEDFKNVAHWSKAKQSKAITQLLNDFCEDFKTKKVNQKFIRSGQIKRRSKP